MSETKERNMSDEYNYSKKTSEVFEIEVKRFHVPGKFRVPCPECGETIDGTIDGDYLNFPNANEWIPYYAWCDNPECVRCMDNEEADEAAPLELFIGVTTRVRARKPDPEIVIAARQARARGEVLDLLDDDAVCEVLGEDLVSELLDRLGE